MGFLRTFINVFGRRQLSFSFRFPFVLRLPLQRLGANFVRAGRRVKAVHSSHPDGGNAVCRPGLLQAGPALQVLQKLTPATAEKDPPRAPKALSCVPHLYLNELLQQAAMYC